MALRGSAISQSSAWPGSRRTYPQLLRGLNAGSHNVAPANGMPAGGAARGLRLLSRSSDLAAASGWYERREMKRKKAQGIDLAGLIAAFLWLFSAAVICGCLVVGVWMLIGK